MSYKKPRLGQKVYLIIGTHIILDRVGFLGKKSFIADEMFTYESSLAERNYERFGVSWTTTLKEAKQIVSDNFEEVDGNFKKIEKGCWYYNIYSD